ncbi:putative membrane protein [Novosphingobium sp. Rr 2-17]|nr:putative membrane protein [Novosphingobium sp. Rr 2-17]
MSLETFSYGLYDTPISVGIRAISWLIPMVQSIHIIAIAVLVGSALVMDLRLAGVLATDESPRTVVRRHLPWLWSALAVLLLTGLVMVTGEPYRELLNTTFWYKMGTVLFAFVLTLLFRYPILHPEFKLEHARWSLLVKPLAWVSLAAWIFVIYCGRWIAYT